MKLLILFAALMLSLAVRGLPGNPQVNDLLQKTWRDDGPFELSPERGRFGLTYSLIEDKSLYFSTELARFIVPDLGYKNGHYVSLFAPGLSFITAPGYFIGRILGAAQVGAFSVVAVFALINLFLITKISRGLGAGEWASRLAGLVFLFATPAFAYSVDLYQHHLSTFLILASVFILMRTKKIWPLFLVFFLMAVSIPLDYPNLILFLPVGIVVLQRLGSGPLKNIWVIAGAAVPLVFFLWFNYHSYGNLFQLSGTIGGVRGIGEDGLPAAVEYFDPQKAVKFVSPEEQHKSALGFFNTRRILQGFYVHLYSPDRGIIVYAPVIYLGILGAVILYRKKNKYLEMLLGIIGLNLVFYSMWGDPWGGWAFGSRYLIPAYAIMAIFLALALTKFNRRLLFIIPFYLLLAYSLAVNTLGAITTSALPPKEEALALSAVSGKQEHYSYDRAWEYLSGGKLKSFVFRTWGYQYLTSVQYFYLLTGSLVLVVAVLIIYNYVDKYQRK